MSVLGDVVGDVGTAEFGTADTSLARRIRSGDRDALGELYDLYAPIALGHAIHVVEDLKQAEDLVHDAFVTVWKQIGRFDDTRDTLRSWVLRIVRTQAVPLSSAAHGICAPRPAPLGVEKPGIAKARGFVAAEPRPARILVIDDDQDVCEVVTAILGEEGYDVVTLEHLSDGAVRAAIGRIEPDCILLDGAQAIEYAEGWVTAAEVRHRDRPIPTVMFTAHIREAEEARQGTSARAVEAGFAAVLSKPFTLDDVVATVEWALEDGVRSRHQSAPSMSRTRS